MDLFAALPVLIRLVLFLLVTHHASRRHAVTADDGDLNSLLGALESELDCNNMQADLVVVLDVSQTQTSECQKEGFFFGDKVCKNITDTDDFDTAKNFITSFVDLMKTFISPTSLRVGVVAFTPEGSANAYLDLADKGYYQDVVQGLRRIPPAPSKTDAGGALFVARTMLGGQSDRYDVTKVIVLLTNGKTLSPMVEALAVSLKSMGIHVMTLAVGDVESKSFNAVFPYSDYVHRGIELSTPSSAYSQLEELACKPLCAWNSDPCFPGQCGDQGLAEHCQCEAGFKVSGDTDKHCKIQTLPNVTRCQLTLRDSLGNEVIPRSSASSQHCDAQQDGFMNIQPTSLTFDLRAEFNTPLGTYPPYVRKAGVGISDVFLTILKVTSSGDETTVGDAQLNTSPACSSDVTNDAPVSRLDCGDAVTLSISQDFTEGERLCVDITPVAGGFYALQNSSGVSQMTSYFPVVYSKRRVCFTYDSTRPAHCSQVSTGTACSAASGSPLELSTRLTHSADIRVSVDDGWMDAGSSVTGYVLEVHEVHAAAGFLSVEEAPITRITLQNDSAPHGVLVTLPTPTASTAAPRLFAVLLEVHDGAGNVAYARRFVLYDNASRVVLDPDKSLKVITRSNRSVTVNGRESQGAVCVEWKGRFYNDGFLGFDYLLPVKPDTTRQIEGDYDQASGVLPVSGTASVHGIVKFEVSWSVGDGAQTDWQTVPDFTTQSACLPVSAPDGGNYRIYVRATDVMNRSATDDVTVFSDVTEPEVRVFGLTGGQGGTGLHVHGSTDLSTMVLVLEAMDPQSGLRSLGWTLGAEGASEDLAWKAVAVQRLLNSTSCQAGEKNCYCPASAGVDPCEIYRYEIRFDSLAHSHAHTGDHHRYYLLTINAVNGAGLRASRTAYILIDASPPTVGVALEGEGGEGGGVNVTTEEADYTREGRLHVRWHGFRDPESAVVMYRVVLAERCLSSVLELEAAENVTEVKATAGSFTHQATLTFPREGHYVTNVVAYNGALAPSPVACSDGVSYHTSAPRFLNVSIAQGRTARALACAPATEAEPEVAWMVSSGLTRTRLPNTTGCSDVCRQRLASPSLVQAVQVDHLPVEEPHGGLGEDEAEELCRSLPLIHEDWWIVLPSDRLLVTWDSLEEEGALQEFYVGAGSSRTSSADLLPMTGTHRHQVYHNSRTGLGQGAVFFLFLRAVNKAGTTTDLVLGPVIVDSTPPVLTSALSATLDRDMNDVTVMWTADDILDTDQPPEFDLKITYRIGHDDGFVTSFTSLNKTDVTDCQGRDSTVSGCLRVPVEELRAHDTPTGRSFFFQLHVQNAAGLTAPFNTSFFLLPSRASHVIVLDISPSMAASWRSSASSDVIEDVDVVLEPEVMCAAWTGSEIVNPFGRDTVEFGVGHNKTSDDVISFVLVDVIQSTACVNVTSAIPFYETVYSLIRITRASGSSNVFSSDGLTIVPPRDPRNTVEVFTGKRCTENEMIHEEFLTTTEDPSTHTVDLPNAASFHTGDVLYVEFRPHSQRAQFPEADVIHATLSGFQVVLTSSAFSVSLTPDVTLPSNSSTSVRIYACEKGVSLWRRKDTVTVSWELEGPGWRFARFLRVRLLDESCLVQRQSASENTDVCVVAESAPLSPSRREMTIDDVSLTTGLTSYVSSVAACFDECLPAVFSRPFTLGTDQTTVTIYDVSGRVQATSSSSSAESLEVTMEASVEPVPPGEPCYFLWTVSRARDGSRPLADWALRKENRCSRVKVEDGITFTGTSRGTLYACIQPVFPRRANAPTCRKMTRPTPDDESDVQAEPFHVIELSQDLLRRLKPSDIHLAHRADGNQLHDLYDLDLDFAGSDLVLAAALATVTSGGVAPPVAVTWFLMTSHASVPENGQCEADPECVTRYRSSEVNASSVVFPRYRSRLDSRQLYFVCALLSPLDSGAWPLGVSDVRQVCGDGFLVDDSPPSPGTVSIGNANDDGYLSNGDWVLVTWSGFYDAEMESSALYGVNVLSYSVALGSYPSGEDVAPFTYVGKRTAWTFDHVDITPGLNCYATVQARDVAGHVTQVSSDPVLFDTTPPAEGRVAVRGLTSGQRCVSSQRVLVTWYEVTDAESGIARQEVGVAGHAHSDRQRAANDLNVVVPFVAVLRGNSLTLTDLSADLVDGHSYVILLRTTNHAGLTTVTSSEPWVADSSPPRVGPVEVETSQQLDSMPDTLHPGNDVYRAQWSGFTDPHCGIAYYRVSLGSSPQQDDVVAFHYVGLRTSYTWTTSLDAGSRYVAVVEACNHAGLCAVSSSQAFLVDSTPPTSGHVIVGTGPRHSPFWGHITFLVARWIGFFDPQSDVREFSWCVGKTPRSCDVTPMTSSLQERSGLAAGLTLPSSVPLYVTVMAENMAGLRTARASNRFLVDTSPPAVLSPPMFLSPTTRAPATGQSDRSTLTIAWSFADPDSPVFSHKVSVSARGQGRHGLADPVAVKSAGPDNALTIQLGRDNLLTDGGEYTASVTACNAAELCTTAQSGPLLVDSTPPVVGTFDPEMKWKVVVASKSASGKRGAGEASVTLVDVAWSDFTDEESGVRGYRLTCGRSYSSDELSDGSLFVAHDSSSRTQRFSLSSNETFQSGDFLVFSLWAENNLGLVSPVRRMTFEVFLESASGEAGTLILQRHSCSPYYCSNECTCSARGKTCQPSNETTATPCRDLSSSEGFISSSGIDLKPRLGCPACHLRFLTSATCLEGHWTVPAGQAPSVNAVSRFQWSFGLAGSPPGAGVMDAADSPTAWHDAGSRTSVTYCLPGSATLSSGFGYVLHVRTWLSRDSYFVQTSPAVIADHSPPARRRGRSVRESVDAPACSSNKDVDFFSEGKTPTLFACWGGVFADDQSGVQAFDVWIGTQPFADDYRRLQNVYLNTSAAIDTSSMIEGTRYYVTVRAVNGAGMTSTVTSDGVMKDVTPPATGAVYASPRHAARHVTTDVTSLSASWDGFYDLHSGLRSFSVALFDTRDVDAPIVDFESVKLKKSHTFENLSLLHGHSYTVAVKARDAAGLESPTAWSSAILIDVTPPHGITCDDFTLTAETTLTSASSSRPFQHERYNATLEVDVTSDLSGSSLLRVELSATSLRPGARGEVAADGGDVTWPLVLRFRALSDRSSAEHVMPVERGQRSVSVVVRGNAGADVRARVFTCSRTVISDVEAVTLRQVSRRSLFVCTNIADDESSVTTLKVGVGSTRGGLQAHHLTLTAGGGHGCWLVTDIGHVQHGTPLYAVVLAQNRAGVWVRFLSRTPVVFDVTPPVISGLDLTLNAAAPPVAGDGGGGGVAGGGGDVAGADGGTSGVEVTAVWSAVDEQSGGVSCTCSLVGHETSDDVTKFSYDVTEGRCQWKLQRPQHGSRVQAVISCRNQVDMLSTKTSDKLTVLVNPPDLSQVSLRPLHNYPSFSPFGGPDALFRSSKADLQFSWPGVRDSTVHQYLYRFTLDSAPLTEWSPSPAYKSTAILKKIAGRRGNVTAEVRALNRKGVVSDIISARVILDDAKPELTGTKVTAGVTHGKLYLDWARVFRTDRNATYCVYAGSSEEFGDVINRYVTTTPSYEAPFDSKLRLLFVNIECVYHNGLLELYRDEIAL